ncbi:MAG TPA: hypothetical protein VFK03_02595 [Candidatus Saccharimonadales bacterium]|nr:hypothetical protein [Candidatus Saccharimonadales bacterium]
MAGKEKQSPKVAHSNNRVRRGAQPGDKQVKRQRRRATGVQHIGDGQDLLSQIHEDRRHEPAAPPNADDFVAQIGRHVVDKANQQHWDATQRKLACDYIKSLVNGDGATPDGMHKGVASTIQWKFVFACLAMKVPDDTFPGQSQDWHRSVRDKAEKVWYKNAA